MNLRVVFLPIKVTVLVWMIFSGVNEIIQLAGVLLFLVVLPKIGSIIELTGYSGYMKSSAGSICMVDKEEQEDAKADGFTDIPLLEAAKLTGVYPHWTK